MYICVLLVIDSMGFMMKNCIVEFLNVVYVGNDIYF